MCGIAVIMNKRTSSATEQKISSERLTSMIKCMEHRGPDEQGFYVDRKVGLAIARLAIVGGEEGSQPIWNEDHSVVIICNGEIYNHQRLRNTLEEQGHVFSTQSDVEVILHLYESRGEKCLNELEGIFAFVIWDVNNQSLLAARDRVGVKPLYYSDTGTEMLFSSELRALLQDPAVNADVNKKELSSYHAFRFVPAGQTLIHGIQKLPPASYMLVKCGHCEIRSYWIADYPLTRGQVPEKEKTAQLRRRLMNAVKSQAAPDVKSGIFLSGGLDSTALLAMHQKLFQDVPDTFTIAFAQPRVKVGNQEYNELKIANTVAGQYGSRHFGECISADEVLTHLPTIITALDEPIADPTAIPLWFVSRLAHQSGVKVALSGEGLDELFGGYAVYGSTRWLKTLKLLPPDIRQTIGSLLSTLGLPGSGVIRRSLLPVSGWYQGVGGVFSPEEWEELILRRNDPDLKKGKQIRTFVKEVMDPVQNKSMLTQMAHFDLLTWLPENTLVKSDKVSMAHSLELRVPFLDRNVVEFSFRTDDRDKIRGNVSKWIVRKALAEQIPENVFHRRKVGFPVPISAWILGEWREFTLSTLLDANAWTRGIYQPEHIEQLMKAPLKARERSTRLLWTLLSLELWFQCVYSSSKAPTRRYVAER